MPIILPQSTAPITSPVRFGSQTTSLLLIVFLAMSLYPSVQAKVHAELDAVIGPDRLPDFGDRDSLVYLDAVVKEAMRWMPPTPVGLTHCTREDDVVNEYFIPAGTVLLGNIWYMNLRISG